MTQSATRFRRIWSATTPNRLLFLSLSLLLIIFSVGEATANVKSGEEDAAKAQIQETYGKLPLYFIRNDGQVDEKVKFYEKGSGHATYFTKEGVYITLGRGEKLDDRSKKLEDKSKKSDDRSEKLEDTFPVIMKDEAPKQSLPKIPSPLAGEGEGGGDKGDMTSQLIKLTFLNANPNPEIIAADQQEGKVNYFIGKDPEKWRTNIPTYRAVVYKEVYPGIDIKFYGNNRQMEYDIIVKPGADPSKVQLAYDGIEGLSVAENGDLEIILNSFTPVHFPPLVKGGQGGFEGEGDRNMIIQKKPIIYQEIDGKRIVVEGRFKILENHYTFELASYDKAHPLVIDPVLVYSTYLGGSSWDGGYGIAVDVSGNAYVMGRTYSTDFPVTPGAYDITPNGGWDVFVAKLDGGGSSIVYATYLGGSTHDGGNSIAVDGSGNAYVTGETQSMDFPATPGTHDTTLNGLDDVFVAKLDGSGSSLLYSTYLGGGSDDDGQGIAVDVSGNAYVTGYTNSSNFPTTPEAYDTTQNGADMFVVKLDSSGASLFYSTYVGGSGADISHGIAVDGLGNAYVTGLTLSTDFPSTPGAYDTTQNGSYDAFVAKLDGSGSSLLYSTYLGGSYDDRGGFGIAVDGLGNVYVTGWTMSTDFPTTPGAYDTTQNGDNDVFVAKFSTELAISGASGNQQTQTVAWNDMDSEYLVLWQDFRNGASNPDIYGARLDSNGNVVAGDLPIVTQTAKQAGPWLSYGGGGYVAVWIDQRNMSTTGTDVYGAWILPDGTVSSELVVTNAPANQRAASVVYNPTSNNFLVTWIDETNGTSNVDVWGAIVNPGGGVSGSPFAMVTETGNQRGPYARYDYGNYQYFMVWFDDRVGNYDIYGSRVSSGGTVLDGSGLIISNATGDQKNARITEHRPADGINNFTLAWIDFRNGQPDIYGALMVQTQSGLRIGSDIVISSGSWEERAATIDVDYIRTKQAVVSWIDNRNGTDFDIYRAQIDQSGVVSGEALVAGVATGAANNQQGPLVSYSDDGGVDNGFLMLWRDDRSGVDYDLYGIKVWP